MILNIQVSTEKLGLTENPLVMLRAEDSIPLRVSMVSFYQDNEGPKVKSVKWANDFTVHVEFAEPIRPTYLPRLACGDGF
jgi:hypothetical protein